MHVRELRKKTTVYENVELHAEPIEWSRAEVVVAYRTPDGEWSLEEGEGNEAVGYIHPCNAWGPMDITQLPVEFFNHQLKEYDPGSEASVRKFVSDWGFPFLPQRNLSKDGGGWAYIDVERINSAIAATDEVRGLAQILGAMWTDEYDRRTKQGRYGTYTEDNSLILDDEAFENYEEPVYGERIPTGAEAELFRSMSNGVDESDAISLEEAALALETLQIAVLNVMHCIRHGGLIHMKHLDVFNVGGSNMRTIQCGGWRSGAATSQQVHSMLTAAICNQMIDAFVDPAPWRDCACEGCDVTFKRKQSKAKAPASDSIYCCSACEERQKKRNQRAAAKNRIQH